jgi:hypothetical protein
VHSELPCWPFPSSAVPLCQTFSWFNGEYQRSWFFRPFFAMSVSGMFADTVKTPIERPELLIYLIIGVGMCYTHLIKSSGPVVAVSTATLRKVVTVLSSYAIFSKPLLPIHSFSSLLVFFGIVKDNHVSFTKMPPVDR